MGAYQKHVTEVFYLNATTYFHREIRYKYFGKIKSFSWAIKSHWLGSLHNW